MMDGQRVSAPTCNAKRRNITITVPNRHRLLIAYCDSGLTWQRCRRRCRTTSSTEADDLERISAGWNLHADSHLAFQGNAGPSGMTIRVDIDAIQACCRDSQSSTTPRDVQPCRGLIGEQLGAMIDQVCCCVRKYPVASSSKVAQKCRYPRSACLLRRRCAQPGGRQS